jgi:hypothetical protein
MFAAVKSVTRGIGRVAMATAAAIVVLLICAAASIFTLACAAPLKRLQAP